MWDSKKETAPRWETCQNGVVHIPTLPSYGMLLRELVDKVVCRCQQYEDRYRMTSLLHYKRTVVCTHHETISDVVTAPFATRLGPVASVSLNLIVLEYSLTNHRCPNPRCYPQLLAACVLGEDKSTRYPGGEHAFSGKLSADPLEYLHNMKPIGNTPHSPSRWQSRGNFQDIPRKLHLKSGLV